MYDLHMRCLNGEFKRIAGRFTRRERRRLSREVYGTPATQWVAEGSYVKWVRVE